MLSLKHTAYLCGFLLVSVSPCLSQADVNITSLAVEGGEVVAAIESPAGELIVQGSADLQPDAWTQLSRLRTDGGTKNFYDPFDPNAAMGFYRVSAIPPADEFHLTGEFASALEAALDYADLQSTFGINFPQNEAVIPPGNDLSFATRNARIYAAVIAALSKLAKDLSDSFPEGSRPTPAIIAAALSADISDGNLNGNNNGSPVPIGTTGTFLPAYTEQDFLDALAHVKSTIPGLYNVAFNSAAASPLAPQEGFLSFALSATPGSLSPSVPAVWGDFYWGSSDWQ